MVPLLDAFLTPVIEQLKAGEMYVAHGFGGFIYPRREDVSEQSDSMTSRKQRECLYTGASLRAGLPIAGIEYSLWHTKEHKQRESNLVRHFLFLRKGITTT